MVNSEKRAAAYPMRSSKLGPGGWPARGSGRPIAAVFCDAIWQSASINFQSPRREGPPPAWIQTSTKAVCWKPRVRRARSTADQTGAGRGAAFRAFDFRYVNILEYFFADFLRLGFSQRSATGGGGVWGFVCKRPRMGIRKQRRTNCVF